MRKLRKRSIGAESLRRLRAATTRINADPSPKEAAERIYAAARKSKWFGIIIDILRSISGPGERCMFCSGSECSQIEHYLPKAVFPDQAMVWENFLWVCGICNNNKGDRFPPITHPGEQLINPLVEDPWDYFFIDEFGNLSERWRPDLNRLDPRAEETVKLLGLDREALQISRQARLDDLKQQINDSLNLFRVGRLSRSQLRRRKLQWRKQPFQPDVADYFLNGPGAVEKPFVDLLRVIR